MNVSRYATRSAVFAAGYLLTAWAAAGPLELSPVALPPVAVAVLWLLAQARFARHRLDVIMLATTAAVAATLTGDGLLASLTSAVGAAIPAVLFAALMNRWLPGYWPGHGDRFRRSRATLGRLAGAATAAALCGVVLQQVMDPGTSLLGGAFQLIRDAMVITLVIAGTRSYRRSREPQRGVLSTVR